MECVIYVHVCVCVYVYVCMCVCIHPLSSMPEGVLGFLGPKVNAELVSKFYVALCAFYAAIPVQRPKLHLNEVPSTFLNFRSIAAFPLQVCTAVQPKPQ